MYKYVMDTNIPYKYRSTEYAFKIILEEGLYHGLKELIKHGFFIGYCDADGWTILMWACLGDHTEIVRVLLQTGESHPEYQTKSGHTALMMACQNGNTKIVQALLQTNNARPELKTIFEADALLIARKRGYTEIVELLTPYMDMNVVAANVKHAAKKI